MCPAPGTWNAWLHWCVATRAFHTIHSHALGTSWVYLKSIAALMCSYPSLSYNTFTCSGGLPTTGYYWNTLEHIGTTWNLYDPKRTVLDSPGCALPPEPEMHSCTSTPPFIQYIHMLWGPLGCAGMRWHSPYYWILLEHIGTTWSLYDPIRTVLDPQYLKCIAALICSYRPAFIQYIHMLWGPLGCTWNA